MNPDHPAPALDDELATLLAGIELPTEVTAEMLPFLRQGCPVRLRSRSCSTPGTWRAVAS
ncbi:MAG: hypothetical protein ACRCYQ_03135 [Nocardioides sp.]